MLFMVLTMSTNITVLEEISVLTGNRAPGKMAVNTAVMRQEAANIVSTNIERP